MLNQQQHHRRTFRGRGGATDRRLPKHNAARRRPNFPKRDDSVEPVKDNAANGTHHLDKFSVDEMLDEKISFCFVDPAGKLLESCDMVISRNADELRDGELEAPPFKKEVDHLLRRFRNNRDSMSRSAVALANPASYQTNVLAACRNSMDEWRAILRHYNLDDETKKATGLAIFELVQQSLQCGPLAGAKPGYFKRCGSEVAEIVRMYLHNIVVDMDGAVNTLCLSQTQVDAIKGWYANAQIAAAASHTPSKSALKCRVKMLHAKKKKG